VGQESLDNAAQRENLNAAGLQGARPRLSDRLGPALDHDGANSG
jgi:hypothetical protein